MEASSVLLKNKQLLPALRFKEFDGAWESAYLNKLSKRIIVGIATSTTEYYVDKTDDAVPIIRNLNIKKGYFDSNDILYITPEFSESNKNKRVKKGDVLIVRTGSNVGLTCVVPDNFEGAQTFTTLIVSPRKELLSSSYLNHLLSSDKGNYQALKLVVGGGKGNLNSNDLKIYPVNFPSLPEQQKIASFLSAVDEKIQLLTRKKELLEQYKKGVMQQLFSGKLRFKDENGKDYPEWEEKRLGVVAEITMGQSPDSNSYNNNAVGIPLIQGNADINGRITNPRQWTSEPTKKCEVGDLILTVRAPVGYISKSYHSACIGRGVCSIRNNKVSNIDYLFQFLIAYEDKWARIEQGSTFTAVNGSDIKNIKLHLPSLPEQLKIATYFSDVDKKLDIIATQITQTQTFKKGLLQQMFV